MDNVRFDVDHLIVKQPLDKRVFVLAKLRLGGFGERHGAEGPDGVGRRQGLRQTSRMLGDIVQGTLDPVNTLQGSC